MKMFIRFWSIVLTIALTIPGAPFAYAQNTPEFSQANFVPQQPVKGIFEDVDVKGANEKIVPPTTTEFLAGPGPLSIATASGPYEKNYYDGNGNRIKKEAYAANDTLLKEWWFEQHKGKERITKYIEYTYDGNWNLLRYRVAVWHYADGGFVKINTIYDPQGGAWEVFKERVNKKGIKFQEDWFDRDGRLLSCQKWDPKTGAFMGHFINVYEETKWGKKLDHTTHLNEKKEVIKREFFTQDGKLSEQINYEPKSGLIKSWFGYDYDGAGSLHLKASKQFIGGLPVATTLSVRTPTGSWRNYQTKHSIERLWSSNWTQLEKWWGYSLEGAWNWANGI